MLEAEEPFYSDKRARPQCRTRGTDWVRNLTGLARVGANAHSALENIALWHERDIFIHLLRG